MRTFRALAVVLLVACSSDGALPSRTDDAAAAVDLADAAVDAATSDLATSDLATPDLVSCPEGTTCTPPAGPPPPPGCMFVPMGVCHMGVCVPGPMPPCH